MNRMLVLAIAILGSLLPPAVDAASTDSTKHWVGTWSAAPYLVEAANMPPSPGLANNTLRQVVRVSIGGDTLRLRFSNADNTTAVVLKSASIAVAKTGSVIDAATSKALSFGGGAGTTMAAGASATSDAVAFALAPGMRVAITIVYGATSSNMTGHVGSRTNSYILAGDKSASADFAGSVSTPHWYSINTLEVRAPLSTSAVAVIGNSITDGYGLVPDLQNRWTDIFSQALLANPSTQNVGVLNMGIGATNVLGTGQTTGNVRFQRDVLEQNGLRWVIIFYGVNDIGGGAGSASLIDGLKKMGSAAKAKGLKVYGATITPFNGNSYYTVSHEAVRQEVNKWIRTGGFYDAVIDFDRAIRDPADTTRMQAALKNDWLHPNTDGYKALGQSVDLKLFTTDPSSVRDRRGQGKAAVPRSRLELRGGSLRIEFDRQQIDGSSAKTP